MPYALDTYTGDGLKASFEVTFPYIQRDQVYVFVDKLKLKVVTTGEPVAGEYKWEDSKNVLLGEAPDGRQASELPQVAAAAFAGTLRCY